jgi:TonB family protein
MSKRRAMLKRGRRTNISLALGIAFALFEGLAFPQATEQHSPEVIVQSKAIPDYAAEATSAGVLHIGGNVKPPKVIHTKNPSIPKDARKATIKGKVEVHLWVDEDGLPSHVRVVKGLGHSLDEATVEAANQYRFKPATLNGKPVKTALYLTVEYF